MGVHLDQSLANARDGVYTYRAQGSIYHRIGGLLPENGSRPRYLQMYVYDTDRELENRIAENDLVDRQVLAILKQILDDYNPYVHVFRQISQRMDLDTIRLHIKEITTDRRQYSLPSASQVAAVLVGGEDPSERNERDIIVQTRTGDLLNVPDTAGFYDPLQYPLLHPYGTFGWDLHIFRDESHWIRCREYYSYMLQVRDNHDSLLLRSGRLLQQYVVDQYVKISTQQLRYIRDHQQTIRAELYQGLQDSVITGELNSSNVGRKTILPPSYIGSPRDMHRRYHDAMALVRKFGKPDIFLTMTCNPNWPEIENQLYPGQLPRDRPDLTTRAFHSKCEELKQDLFKHHVLGKVVAHVHVIEFQKRGLPHAHFLLILDENDKLRTPEDYDKVVRAEIPDPAVEPELYDVVLRHMIHGPCGPICINKKGKCKKKFPKEFSDFTMRGNDSYPRYNGRVVLRNGNREVDNRWVVPYNPWLLKRYNCHINVEICSSIKSVKYLYKYVYKGSDRIMIEVSGTSHDHHDEIKQFVDARWVCPQEAFWRIFMFPLNRMYPAVYSLQIHLPNMHEITFQENQNLSVILADERNSRTMLTEFFETNRVDPQARQYLYEEFPEHYTWDKDNMRWHRRRSNYRVIGRLFSVSPIEGERYYVRLLLTHRRGPISFPDLRTVNSITYNTFKEAAEHMGLLERDNAIRETLLEASSIRMPAALRRLFVMILVYCNPAGTRDLWNEFHSFMMEDYPSTSSNIGNHMINRLLKDIDCSLNELGKSLSDYDLPRIDDYPVENIDYIPNTILEEQSVPVPEEDLTAVTKFNSGQMHAFNTIIDAVHKKKGGVFFIDGPGGTGKTFLYRSILATIRKEGHIAIATATSGIAAIMMPGGRTAHSRFKIPIPTLANSTCKISKRSDLAILLQTASVIIWDEATMTHRFAFEALDRTLKDLFDNDLPFGGKVFVLGGDFRQVLPVVNRGRRFEAVDACIAHSPIWQHVKVLQLSENMRAKADPAFSDFLLCIGNGTEPHVSGEDMIRLPDDLVIPWEGDHSVNHLIDEVYPRLLENARDTSYITQRALIAPKNKHVELLNHQVIQIFPGEEHTYYSFDYVENDINNLYQQEFLHTISLGELPPHKLTLKLGSPIILLRNLDPKNGLCNGTRLICRGFYYNFIYAEIITGSFCGEPVLIPRIPLKCSDDVKVPFPLIRKQFPVRLSFALTINKSQGQTIPHVGIYLPEHVFSHGQLYVALSRGKSKQSTKILVKDGLLDGTVGVHTRNVVFTQVLHPRS